MSCFFSLSRASASAAVCSADNWRSVVKMLNSASSWPKAAPVSAVLSSLDDSVSPWPSPTTMGFENAEKRLRSSVKSCRMSTELPE